MATTRPLLEARGLTRRFGGLTAVDAVDLDLSPGEVHALIGPNGAGKTTLVSLISGRLLPDEGTIRFENTDITRLPAHARVRLGIAYTFQITAIFPRLSVFDNVALAAQRHAPDRAAATHAALARVGLDAHAGRLAGTLAYGHQRLLEVAMGLALAPKLLILDEPTQGLALSEIAAFKSLVRSIAAVRHGPPDRARHGRRHGPRDPDHRPRRRPPPRHRHAHASPRRPRRPGRLPRRMTLVADNLHAAYGPVRVLHGAGLTVAPGEILVLMGRNGAGKSTLLKTLMGLVRPSSGTVTLDATRLDTLPAHAVPHHRLAWVPQGRRLFAELTVAENLTLGLMTNAEPLATRDRALALFPRLSERLPQTAGTLSGGEQQMLAIARALCTGPRVLLLDEPTEGLQPSLVAQIRATIRRLRDTGVATILVESHVEAALALADRITFVETGRTPETLPTADLTPAHPAFRTYVGV